MTEPVEYVADTLVVSLFELNGRGSNKTTPQKQKPAEAGLGWLYHDVRVRLQIRPNRRP